jgi:hypothetical protein
MFKIPENLFTILEFSDTDGGRVYRGENAIQSLDESGLIAFEAALDELDQDIQKIYLKSTPVSSLSFDPEWETHSLSYVLTAAIDNGTEVKYHRRSDSMLHFEDGPIVTYFGFDPSQSSILTDSRFAEILEKNSYSLANEEGEPIEYSQVGTGSVWVFDSKTETGIAIIHDGLVEAQLTAPGFVEIVKLMDSFQKEHSGARLFLDATEDGVNEVYYGDRAYDWEFDLMVGKYRDPAAS